MSDEKFDPKTHKFGMAYWLREFDIRHQDLDRKFYGFVFVIHDDEWPSIMYPDGKTGIVQAERLERAPEHDLVPRADLMQSQKEGWQPIETAPKDGTDYFAYAEYFTDKHPPVYIVGHFKDDGFYLQDGGELSYNYTPTHWMPLPPAPDAKKESL